MDAAGALCQWLNAMSSSEATDLEFYADGSMMCAISQDLMPDFDFEGCQSSGDLNTVQMALESFYNKDLCTPEGDLPTVQQLTEYLLATCVQNEKREEYIQEIMALPEDVQTVLMEIIEDKLNEKSAEADTAASSSLETESYAVAGGMASSTPFKASGAAMTPSQLRALASPMATFAAKAMESNQKNLGALATAAAIGAASPSGKGATAGEGLRMKEFTPAKSWRMETEELKQQNIALQEEVEDLRDMLEQTKRENEGMAARLQSAAASAARATLVPSEAANLLARAEKEMELRKCHAEQEEQLKSALKEAEGQVKLLTSKCTKATQELEMAQKWKDELDVLRPQAAAKDRLDSQIEKYKKKLETFDEMKATMKRLEGTNAELIARNLDLEREAAKVAPLRTQLDDVRDSKIMSDVRISELELALAQAKGAADEYKAALQAATERAAVEWQQPSVEVMSLEQLTPAVPASSLADGVNDFNPAVAERLARLERENSELRASADSNTLTRLDEMEKNLDETKRMKAVFESRYYAGKTRIAELESEVATAKATIASLTHDLEECRAKLAESENFSQDVSGQLSVVTGERAQLQKQLNETEAGWKASNAAFETQVHDLQAAIEATKASLAQTREDAAADKEKLQRQHKEQSAELEAMHASAQRRLEQLLADERSRFAAEKDALTASHSSSAAMLKQMQSDALSSLQNEFRATVDRMQSEHSAAMSSLRAEYKNTVESMTLEHSLKTQKMEEDFNARYSFMQEGLTRRLRDLEEDASASTSSIREKMNAKLRELEDSSVDELRRVRREHAESVAALKADFATRVNDLETERDMQAARFVREKENITSSLTSDFSAQITALRAEKESSVSQLAKERDTAIFEWTERFEQTTAALKQQAAQQLSELQAKYDSDLAATKEALQTQLEERREAHSLDVKTLKDDFAEQMRKTLAKHDYEINTERRQHAEQLGAAQSELKKTQNRLEHEAGSLRAAMEIQQQDLQFDMSKLAKEYEEYKASHTISTADFDAKANMAKKMIADARGEVQKLTTELNELKQQNEEQTEQMEELQGTIDQYELQVEEQQDKLQTLEAELYHASLRSRMGLGSGGEGRDEGKGKTTDAAREAANAELEAVVSKATNLLELNGKLIAEKKDLSDQLTAVLQELHTARTSIRQMTEEPSGDPVEEVAPKRSTRIASKTTADTQQGKIARRIKVDPQVAAKEETIAEMAIRIQELQGELASNVDEQRRHELLTITEYVKPFEVEVQLQKLRTENGRLKSQITHMRLLLERMVKSMEEGGLETEEFSEEIAAVEAVSAQLMKATSEPPIRATAFVVPETPAAIKADVSEQNVSQDCTATTADLLGLMSPFNQEENMGTGPTTPNSLDASAIAEHADSSARKLSNDSFMSAGRRRGLFSVPHLSSNNTVSPVNTLTPKSARITSSLGTHMSAARPSIGSVSFVGGVLSGTAASKPRMSIMPQHRALSLIPSVAGRKSIMMSAVTRGQRATATNAETGL